MPDPKNTGTNITYTRTFNEDTLTPVIAELQAWREELGNQLWDNWPEVTRPRRSSIIPDLPKGVACYLSVCKRAKAHWRPYLALRVYCYWVAYGEGRNAKGNYPQRNKSWSLPLASGEAQILATVAKAQVHLEQMRAQHPKPPRSQFRY